MRTTCNSYLKLIPRSEWLVSVVFGVVATILIAAQAAASQIVITPSSSWPMLAGSTQAVNNGPGNQTNPRVNCNVVSYTFDDLEGSSTIHYFDLVTGIDSIAPGNTLDRLSEINGSHLAFTEIDANGDHIVVYDTVTHTIAVVPGFHRFFPRIGGNTLAFWQGYYASPQTAQEIGVYDLTTGAVTMLTNDALPDQFPAVSPSGDVVVWKKCEADGTSCHVYSAVRSSTGVFTTQALTGGTGSEDFPQTDGNIVSYISNRSGDDDIYYQPVGGGTETHISIPGVQREPTISGNLLAFESNQTGEYEVFVYDMNSGTLYQVTTSTSWGYVKTLNHLSVCNGTGRVVYATPGLGAFDVYAFTFQPPDPPSGRITDLIALVRGFGLPNGIQTSLVVKLQDAIAALNTGDTATACMALADFINEVNAQSGKKLTVQQAQQLLQSATTIRGIIGCG